MDTTQRHGSTRVELDLSEVRPQELLRVQRLARELRLVDQILSNDVDTLRVVKSGPAPAWTTLDGDAVSFAYNQMPAPDTAFNVAVWLGTNAHELGHVLYSPRKSSTLMFRVLESERTFLPGVAMLHNIVEDQRQERLILARFTPWTAYLTAALGHHLQVSQDAWLLMAGRTWLPERTRAAAKAASVHAHGHTVTDKVTRIVGEYQRLVDPGEAESDEAWQLLQELHALFADAMPKIPTGCTVMEGGDPDLSEPGAGAPSTADEADAAPSDGGNSSASSDGDDGDDDADGDGDGNDGQATVSQEPTAPSNGNGAGTEHAEPGQSRAQIREDLRKATERLLAEDDVADDLGNIMDAIDQGRGDEHAEGPGSPGTFVEATDAARTLHREVADALLDLKDEVEPGWLKRTDSGRLNVRRLLNPTTDSDELFDRYEPGMLDTAELEVVVLLDVSGSMASNLHRVGEATWAIRQAVDDLEGRCSVFTWDSGPHAVLADWDDRPDGRMFIPEALGGTNPQSVLHETFRLLAGSATQNRVVVILTDGQWSNRSKCDEVIRSMNASGITTVCALIGVNGTPDSHACQVFAHIDDDPAELARLFRKVATDRMLSWR